MEESKEVTPVQRAEPQGELYTC